MDNDGKKTRKAKTKKGQMTESLTEKLSTKLRHLLVEKDDFAEILCSLGSTSETEAHHARIIRRGYHVKGTLKCLLTSFDLI